MRLGPLGIEETVVGSVLSFGTGHVFAVRKSVALGLELEDSLAVARIVVDLMKPTVPKVREALEQERKNPPFRRDLRGIIILRDVADPTVTTLISYLVDSPLRAHRRASPVWASKSS